MGKKTLNKRRDAHPHAPEGPGNPLVELVIDRVDLLVEHLEQHAALVALVVRAVVLEVPGLQ